jgi:hypothetical protein
MIKQPTSSAPDLYFVGARSAGTQPDTQLARPVRCTVPVVRDPPRRSVPDRGRCTSTMPCRRTPERSSHRPFPAACTVDQPRARARERPAPKASAGARAAGARALPPRDRTPHACGRGPRPGADVRLAALAAWLGLVRPWTLVWWGWCPWGRGATSSAGPSIPHGVVHPSMHELMSKRERACGRGCSGPMARRQPWAY